MLYDLYRSDVPDPEVSLSRRDLLIEYRIPVEAWIDLRILETWFRRGVPVPLACLLGYVLSLQREDGSFSVDGIVYHDAKTCPNNSNNRYGMPERLQDRLGVPFVVIDGDLNDLRCYSEEQAITKIEAFIEQLDG